MNLFEKELASVEERDTLIMPSWVSSFVEHTKLITARAYLIDSIKSLGYNEKKGITVVVFKDGTVIKKKTVEGDQFDLNIGVSLCLADYLFGSSTQFHKKVQTLKNKHDKRKEK